MSGVEVSLVRAAGDGCYEASRAAALSGVPKSTVYWWAKHGVVIPSVSPTREMLWSFSDLMALRIVSWLRHPKLDDGSLPPSPMPRVREALALLEFLDLDLCASNASPLLVDRSGKIFVRTDDGVMDLRQQPSLLPKGALQLLGPFGEAGGDGPDLLHPRPNVWIIPAKVAGEPHLAHSRITTQSVAALAARGFSADRIATIFDVEIKAVLDGIDLEYQLGTLAHVA